MPKMQTSKPSDSQKSGGRRSFNSAGTTERNILGDQSPESNEQLNTADDIWLAVDEILLFTQPTTASPPSRPPPSLVIKEATIGSTGPRKDDESFSQSTNTAAVDQEVCCVSDR